jgi:hypothetical protein
MTTEATPVSVRAVVVYACGQKAGGIVTRTEAARALLAPDGHVRIWTRRPETLIEWETHGIRYLSGPGAKWEVIKPADGARFLDALFFEFNKGGPTCYAIDSALGDTIPPHETATIQEGRADQPRVPAGNHGGGQWASDSGTIAGAGAHSGDTHAAGITSARAGKSHAQVFRDMRAFQKSLEAVPGVSGVVVAPAVGQSAAWGWEPSWNVVYKGNGAAKALVAQTAQAMDQDAAFILTGGCKGPACSPVVEYTFHGTMNGARHAAVDAVLKEQGFEGWTWAKSNGESFVRAVHIKDWTSDTSKLTTPMAFVRASHVVATKLQTAGVKVSVDRRNVSIDLLTRSTYGKAQQ